MLAVNAPDSSTEVCNPVRVDVSFHIPLPKRDLFTKPALRQPAQRTRVMALPQTTNLTGLTKAWSHVWNETFFLISI